MKKAIAVLAIGTLSLMAISVTPEKAYNQGRGYASGLNVGNKNISLERKKIACRDLVLRTGLLFVDNRDEMLKYVLRGCVENIAKNEKPENVLSKKEYELYLKVDKSK